MSAKADLKERWHGPGAVESIVNRASGEHGLLSVQRLFIRGQAAPYVSLAHEAVAKAGDLLREEHRRTAYGRSRIVDTLWIMIPLMFLAAAANFYWMRVNTVATLEDNLRRMTFLANDAVERAEGGRLPQYRGLLTQAQQALQAGNALQARQTLLTVPAGFASSFDPSTTRWLRTDMRGFEWRYLWKQLHGERYRFEGHKQRIDAVALTPDGRLVASAGFDGTTKIANLARGQVLATLGSSQKGPVHALAFSPDGKTLATAGADKLVRLWDVGNLKDDYGEIVQETKTLSAHEGPVLALAYSKDGLLASAGLDRTIILWDAGKSERQATLKGEHKGPVQALAFSPDGKTLASAGEGAALVLWDVPGGKKKNTISTALDQVTTLAFAPDGTTLAGGGAATESVTEIGRIQFWDPATGKESHAALLHAMGVFSIAYHPDGKSLASAGRDTSVRLWEVASGKETARWIGNLAWVRAIAISADGDTLVSGGYDRVVRAWDTAQPSGSQILDGHKDWVLSLALGDDDRLLASGGRDGAVKLWEAATGRALGELPRQAGAVTGLTFVNAKQPTLAVAAASEKGPGSLKLYALQRDKKGIQAKETKSLTGHAQGVTAIAYSSEHLLASGDADGSTILWDIEAGKAAQTIRSHKGAVRALAFAQKGQLLLTGGQDGFVRFWDTTTGRPARKGLPAHTAPVEAIAVLEQPDAQKQVRTYFMTGGQDQSVKVWRLEPASDEGFPAVPTASSQAHNQPVSAVVAQKGLLASAGWDQTIKIWDDNGNERLTLVGPTGPIRALVNSRDLMLLVSAGNDGKVRLWRAAKIDETRRPGPEFSDVPD